MKVIHLLLQFPMLPLGFLEISLQLIDFIFKVDCLLLNHCNCLRTGTHLQLLNFIAKVGDPTAHAVDHLTDIMHTVNQGHNIVVVFGISPSSPEDEGWGVLPTVRLASVAPISS
ncbi:hypothetical protein BHM03_00004810 [Ensete ventricosum]|nr:hypothetical protein BHM03_00004810 [Ensete ventricosum]